MNQKRRKVLSGALEQLRATDRTISSVLDQEQDALSNWPESLEGTDRYEESEAACEAMDDALDCIRDASDALTNIIRRNL